jgi:PAS domain-containing protein
VSRKLIVTDSRGDRELLLVGKMVVGRDPACDVSDADPLLSRRHAEFVVGARDVMVRDLGSRNGILVNGIKVGEGALRPGDIVQIGHLQLRYVEDTAPLAAAPEGGEDSDATAVIPQGSAPRAAGGGRPTLSTASAAVAPAALDDNSDKTRVVAPSSARGMPQSPPAAEDDDKTRLIAAPPAARAAQRPAPAARPVTAAPATSVSAIAPAPLEPSVRPAAAGPKPAVQQLAAKADRAPRVAKRPWTLVVLIQVTALSAIVFLATAIPLILWQGRVLNATAASRASALVNWLAADAAAALQTGGSIAATADGVAKEPGIVSAFILSPEGHVLAPASRSMETVNSIPALGVKPGDVLHLQQAWNGELMETARPVQTKDGARRAVAWITFRPSVPPEAGSGAVVLALPVIIVLVATYMIATLIGRRTMRSLKTLNEDIELAVGGQLDAIGDPLGAKPVKELSDAVNYLIARLRSATADQGGTPDFGAGRSTHLAAPAVGPRRVAEPAPARSAQPVAAARSNPVEARIVANAQFRVTEASAGCADLIGARPDALVGEHLIDAIPDRQISDAVMRCLSGLTAEREQRMSVALADRPYKLSILMTRAGKDQPINITFRAEPLADAT